MFCQTGSDAQTNIYQSDDVTTIARLAQAGSTTICGTRPKTSLDRLVNMDTGHFIR